MKIRLMLMKTLYMRTFTGKIVGKGKIVEIEGVEVADDFDDSELSGFQTWVMRISSHRIFGKL